MELNSYTHFVQARITQVIASGSEYSRGKTYSHSHVLCARYIGRSAARTPVRYCTQP